MSFSDVELSIIFTLAYSDQFSFPLTSAEIWARLIQLDQTAKRGVTLRHFERALKQLLQQRVIEISNNYFFLAGRAQLTDIRGHRAEIAREKLTEVRQLQKILRFFPGIKAVFVTGSAAMENAEQDDDLDLCVIIAVNRLWLNRLLIVTLSWFLGKKKTRTDEGKHGWCFNLWLDEAHLQLPAKSRTLYQAYEVIQAKPIWGSSETIRNFYLENNWLKSYLPHFDLTEKVANNPVPSWFHSPRPRVSKTPWLANLLDQLNNLSYQLQILYMSRHRTSEKVAAGFAFFHPRPTANLIEVGWLEAIRRLKNQPELATIAAIYAERFFAKKTERTEKKR